MVFIPLYPKFPLTNIPGTYVAVRIEDLMILGISLIWFLGNFNNLKKYFSQTIFQAILLFWLIGGLSLLSALLITYSIQPHLGFLHWLRRVEYMMLFVMVATSIRSVSQVKIILGAVFLTTILVVLYGFGQIWLNFPVISTTNKEFSKGLILYLSNNARVNSTFAGHYDLAVYLSMVLMFFSSLFFSYRSLLKKIGFAALGILSFILLGFTAARVSFVATLMGLAITLWLTKNKLLIFLLLAVALAVVAIIPDLRHRLVATITVNLMQGGGPKYNPPPGKVTIFTPLSYLPDDKKFALKEQIAKEATVSATSSGVAVDTVPGEPMNTTELGVYRSFGIRLNVEWPRAIAAFYRNPVLGTGYSSITLATDNDFLRVLGETGILGILSLALIFFILSKKMILFLRESSGFEHFLAVGTFCLTIVVLLSAIFIDVLESSKIAEMFWLILGMMWAVMIKYRKD